MLSCLEGSASELPTRTEKALLPRVQPFASFFHKALYCEHTSLEESGAQARDGEAGHGNQCEAKCPANLSNACNFDGATQPFTAPLIPLPVAMLASAPGLSRSFLKLWTPASARAAAQHLGTLEPAPLDPECPIRWVYRWQTFRQASTTSAAAFQPWRCYQKSPDGRERLEHARSRDRQLGLHGGRRFRPIFAATYGGYVRSVHIVYCHVRTACGGIETPSFKAVKLSSSFFARSGRRRSSRTVAHRQYFRSAACRSRSTAW